MRIRTKEKIPMLQYDQESIELASLYADNTTAGTPIEHYQRAWEIQYQCELQRLRCLARPTNPTEL